jgi:tryptophanyl-tRNA synthetase
MRILSGLKPTGDVHLGNYFGAMRQWIDLQTRGEGYYFIADLHALDQVRDAALMREYCHAVALDYLALGLDPEHALLFRQSDIPEIPMLMWALGSVTPMGLLQRGHAYKDAVAKEEQADFGLFAYPVLMAADILMYHSEVVPVGQDQKQHVEFTRDIAVKFNSTYCPGFDPQTGEGGVLRIPESMILEETGVVPGTDGNKMSKSYGNIVPVFGTNKQVKKSIMRTVTDSTAMEDPKDPDTCNVFAMLKLFCGEDELASIAADYRAGGNGYGHYKGILLERFHEQFDAARDRRAELASDPDYIAGVLETGARKARETAAEVLDGVLTACGIRG